MKCNACWTNLEERGIVTTCGHIFYARKILSSDSPCPLCEQILSKSHMKPVNLNPNDDWVNMVMAGVPPHCIMKSAFKGVIFWIEQKDVEAQLTVDKARQLHRKYEEMQTKFSQKIEQLHAAYQKAVRKIQFLQEEKESLAKDNAELQEKFAEKSRQKRKLDEMYDELRNDYEKLKCSSIAPRDSLSRPTNMYAFANPSAFGDPMTRTNAGESMVMPPITPAKSSDLWPGQPQSTSRRCEIPGPNRSRGVDTGIIGHPTSSTFFTAAGTDMFTPSGTNPSNVLRNLLISPLRKPPSRFRHTGFN
ncbi:hypothetical protein O6H91_06G144900 [Diphasiastrum complanatum]|uniref:Uncharacterized protein n=2 Tax=Diphasiastrum complanatum TaxID=34168 RepID=A0ACC2DJX6_DIPCM|nr:hypothetical protein O6H91_06G144900 [Diphasiastrum complanatum]KAJ7554554.1 hypothetical protein O6H91_06G144900 [Diphasiastrum complanatum]